MKIDNKKRICKQCNRVLQNSLHDKCMFCGAAIPDNLILSDSEKDKLRKEYEKRSLERQKRINKSRNSEYSGIGNYASDVGEFGGGGDC